MSNWSDATLSTTASIAKLETEINSLTSDNWADKITIAKEIIADFLEVALKSRHYDDYIDFDAGEDIKDLVSNPTVFNLSSDYLVLHLIYDDLAQGKNESAYWVKKEEYYKKYKIKIEEDLWRIEISTDLDSDTELYMQDVRKSRQITR